MLEMCTVFQDKYIQVELENLKVINLRNTSKSYIVIVISKRQKQLQRTSVWKGAFLNYRKQTGEELGEEGQVTSREEEFLVQSSH